MISLTFSSAPPSLNNAYVNIPGRGRVASKKLVEWKKTAGWELVLQKPRKFDGPVIVEMTIQRNARQKRSDIDNRLKAALDLLVRYQIVKDDSLVMSVTARWISSGVGPACVLTISEASS